MSDIEVHTVSVNAAPGLSPIARDLLGGRRSLPTAAPVLADLDRVQLRTGGAWSDPQWQSELRNEHVRWRADANSMASLDRLRDGASCVVTGQQPGLLLGPLYTAYKILGAIALAAELERRHDRPVVAVYWCGGDDSDFEEVRRAWLWRAGEGPFRAELGAGLWRPGQRIGSVTGTEIARLERDALERLGPGSGRAYLLSRAARMVGLESLGDRAASWALQLFAGSGLVVVDARSAVLRRHGEELFAHYAGAHRRFTAQLREHAAQLRAGGWSTPLDDRALESGLFLLEGEQRRKLMPHELSTVQGDRAPSVLLRPLWQDQALAPVAAVLGPSELQYHAQIAPLYGALDVQAARPAPRPHLTLWPRDAPWIEPSGATTHWLEGGVAAQHALREAQLPAAWTEAWNATRDSVEATLVALAADLEDPRARELTVHARAAMARELQILRRRLAHHRADLAGIDVDRAATWLALHGTAQERALAAPLLWWWGADATKGAIEKLGAAYVAAIDEGRAPTWVLRGGETW